MTISLLNWEYQFNMKHNWNLLSNERKTKVITPPERLAQGIMVLRIAR
jgi:hypothetical protein